MGPKVDTLMEYTYTTPLKHQSRAATSTDLLENPPPSDTTYHIGFGFLGNGEVELVTSGPRVRVVSHTEDRLHDPCKCIIIFSNYNRALKRPSEILGTSLTENKV